MIRHPFAGWPKTEPIENGYVIKARHHTPFTIKLASAIAFILTALLTLWIIMMWVDHGQYMETLGHHPSEVGTALILFVWVPLYPLLYWDFRLIFRRHTPMIFKPRFTQIGKMTYDTDRITAFGIKSHEKAEDEERDLQYKLQTGKIKPHEEKKLRLYTDSHHIMMEYQGQSVNVTDVYGKKEAEKLQHRMNAVFQLVNHEHSWKTWQFDRDPEEVEKKKQCYRVFGSALALIFSIVFALPVSFVLTVILSAMGGGIPVPMWFWFFLTAAIAWAILAPLDDHPRTRAVIWALCKRFPGLQTRARGLYQRGRDLWQRRKKG